MSGANSRPLVRDVAATLALCAYTIAVAAGFARVFSGWAFLSDMVLIAIVGHGISFALRRAKVSGWVAVPFVTAMLLWLLTVLYYRDTTNGMVPGSSTWDQIEVELSLVRDQFPTAIAPVLYGAGWASLSAFALVLVLVMADSFAFRAEARGEALVPGGVLFVFIAALGSSRLRITVTVLLIAAGVLAVVALRQLHDRNRSTVLSARRRSVSWTAPAALATAACIAVLAGVVGPRIPGANAEPLYETKGRNGTNLIDNPFVDIRSRLTNQGNLELFRVNADQEAYWRVITLAQFDGERFALPARPLADLDPAQEPQIEGRRIRQQLQILALTGDVIPAAADPVQASGQSQGEKLSLRQQPDSNTLIAPQDLRPGDLFDIVSVAPSVTADTLRTATSSAVPDPVYLALPDGLPDELYERTQALTNGLTTSYDKALALQAWFRDPNEFRYSLDVQSGHGSNAIESFFRVRAGYCEQFSATFAAMARAAGIPSRVAVGYTPGVQAEPGWYTVIGKNSHAWPELWFDGVGWVPFEPTPGRGAPGAEAYTGVEAAQDESGQTATGSDDGEVTPVPTAPPTVVPGQSGTNGPTTTVRPGAAQQPDGGFNTPSPFESSDPDAAAPPDVEPLDSSLPMWPLVVVGVLGVVAIAPWAIRRALRLRQRAHGPAERVAAAWARARAAAVDAGVGGVPSMTAREWTLATSAVLPVAARPMGSLAEVVDLVNFERPDRVDIERRGSFGASLADDCVLWSEQVCRVATDHLTRAQRVRRYFTDIR